MEPALKVIHGSTRRVWVWKAASRALAFVAAVVTTGLVASYIKALDGDHVDYTGSDYMISIFFLGPAIFSSVWNAADIICILTLAGHRGIHPTACVVVDLVLWVVLLLMNLFPYVMCSGTWCQTTVRFRPDFRPIGLPYNFFDPTFYFAIFLCIFHFGLFIFACVQAAAWNRSAVRVVVDPDDEEYIALSGQLYRFYLDNAPGSPELAEKQAL